MWLTEAEWKQRRRRHEERVDALLGEHLARRSRGQKHPVADFLGVTTHLLDPLDP